MSPVTAPRCHQIAPVAIVVVIVNFFSNVLLSFLFGLFFVMHLLMGLSFWFWLDGPTISSRAIQFLFNGNISEGGLGWSHWE